MADSVYFRFDVPDGMWEDCIIGMRSDQLGWFSQVSDDDRVLQTHPCFSPTQILHRMQDLEHTHEWSRVVLDPDDPRPS